MTERRPVPIGIDDFREVREVGYCYVDKSELISDIVAQKAKVYLFTRPRRFGKSLNLSMIQRFFDIRDKGNRWFDGLKVMEHPEAVSMMGTRPVIHIDMKGLPVDDYGLFVSTIGLRISKLYESFDELEEDGSLKGASKGRFTRGIDQRLTVAELQDSLHELSSLLNARYGIAPVVLIDEYDDPIDNAHGRATYEEILGFLRGFYTNVLKGNKDLGFAVVTGIMQIAKESIFSGLNNLYVSNIFSDRYDERYGFTPAEAAGLCAEYGNPDAFAEAKAWYDGYRFGKAEIYNPWSLLNYIDSGFEPGTYWAGTSGNDILETLVAGADDDTYSELRILGDGGSITDKDVSPTVVMSDIGTVPDAIYSVMAMTGYLNAVPGNGGYDLSIPNREMYSVFSKVIAARGLNVSSRVFNGFFDAAERNDVPSMERFAFAIFAENFQDWDLSDEGAYRRILAGAAMCRCGRYTVTSEAQSGNGRSDMIMTRNSPAVPNIVMEFKKSASDDPTIMLKDAREGLAQIKGKEYYHALEGRTILYGISMANKKARIVSEELVLRPV